jgi:hypothetical protein
MGGGVMGVDRYLEAQHEALSQYPKVCEKLRKAEAERDLARRMAVRGGWRWNLETRSECFWTRARWWAGLTWSDAIRQMVGAQPPIGGGRSWAGPKHSFVDWELMRFFADKLRGDDD